MPVLELIADVDHDAQKCVDNLRWRMRDWDGEEGIAAALASRILRVAERITQHDRKLIPALVDIKYRVNSAMEQLDDDTARHCSEFGEEDKKLNEGFKLGAYEFLKVIQEDWEELITMTALLELGYICKSAQQVTNNSDKYIASVRSKIEAKVEKMESAEN